MSEKDPVEEFFKGFMNQAPPKPVAGTDFVSTKDEKLDKAIAKIIEEGKVKTYDMMKLRGGSDAINKGAATTQQITDEVISKL